jgi:hypothetical protein
MYCALRGCSYITAAGSESAVCSGRITCELSCPGLLENSSNSSSSFRAPSFSPVHAGKRVAGHHLLLFTAHASSLGALCRYCHTRLSFGVWCRSCTLTRTLYFTLSPQKEESETFLRPPWSTRLMRNFILIYPFDFPEPPSEQYLRLAFNTSLGNRINL